MGEGLPAVFESRTGRLIIAHIEVRKWLYVSSFVIGLIAGFPLGGEIIQWLLDAEGYVPDGVQVIILQPMEVILLQLRIAVQVSIGLTLTVFIVDIAFIGIGNSQRTAKSLAMGVKTSGALFALLLVAILGGLGLVYAHTVLIPFLLEYLAEDSAGSGLQSTWQLQKWVGFVTGLYFSSMICFQVPVLVIYLLKYEIMDREFISQNRAVIWFLALFLGALISPPDPISLFLVGGPMLLLLELALIYDRIF